MWRTAPPPPLRPICSTPSRPLPASSGVRSSRASAQRRLLRRRPAGASARRPARRPRVPEPRSARGIRRRPRHRPGDRGTQRHVGARSPVRGRSGARRRHYDTVYFGRHGGNPGGHTRAAFDDGFLSAYDTVSHISALDGAGGGGAVDLGDAAFRLRGARLARYRTSRGRSRGIEGSSGPSRPGLIRSLGVSSQNRRQPASVLANRGDGGMIDFENRSISRSRSAPGVSGLARAWPPPSKPRSFWPCSSPTALASLSLPRSPRRERAKSGGGQCPDAARRPMTPMFSAEMVRE